jgi:hypothetical protein
MPNIQRLWVDRLPQKERCGFKAYRQFNTPVLRTELSSFLKKKSRIDESMRALFNGKGPFDQLAQRLIERRCLPLKEVLESAETFERIRKGIRGPVVADLCCGHGLVGLLFAYLERSVETVYLVDHRFPPSLSTLLDIFDECAPWVRPKIKCLQKKVKGIHADLPKGTSLVGVHACGARTDWVIQAGSILQGPIAVMPCCYTLQSPHQTTFRQELGLPLSIDIERTYTLKHAHYDVIWKEIPVELTPMNRILLARPLS